MVDHILGWATLVMMLVVAIAMMVFTVRSFVALERAIKRMDELLTEADGDDDDEDAPPDDWREMMETGWAKAKRHEQAVARWKSAFERLRQVQDAPRVVALRVVREKVANARQVTGCLPKDLNLHTLVLRDAVLAILDAEIGAARTPDAVVLEGMLAMCEESFSPDEFARLGVLVDVLRTRRQGLRDGATAPENNEEEL